MPEVGLTIPQRPKCKAATLGSNMLKTRSNTVGISKTQNADSTAHTEHTLLPGYTVEGLEQAKTEHAAAEVSEGGIFTPENQEKPSVLGKLSVAKTQEKTPTTPGTAMKKKEDIQL